MMEIPRLSIVTLLPVKDTLSPDAREKVKAPELTEVGFKKSGENPKSVLIGNKYYSGYYFYKDLIKND